ncbi:MULTISPECIES: hypothetical protein [unclassified Nocardia]|uniref:hypothetical protein n=1 Tax=unclassified Nocardia TaxID=2637762 RepID=UPI001CE3C22A|nr:MULTISPECIES: hypothetical protein [unclassified Nocardia]
MRRFDAATLRALEPDFRRAPSAHNTQPWTLTYRNDSVEIGWNPAHSLPASDPGGRDLLLSLGAFVECCLIVCADAGLCVGFEADRAERRIGRLVPAASRYGTSFTTADIRCRASHRGAYLPGTMDEAVLARLADIAAPAGLRLLPGADLRKLLYEADFEMFGNPSVVGELHDWLRLTPHHPNYRRDGLTDRALSLSRSEAFGLRLALGAYPALRRAGLPRLLAAASRGPLDDECEVLVLIGPPDEADTVALGRVLLRIWLTLSRNGYATHPLSQLIDSARTREQLSRATGIDDPARLLHIARVGRPAATPVRSHRR